MKKFAALFLILNIAFGLVFAADSRTYTFGAVKISQDNELPSGYFTKAKNYLPGDNIAITNPQNGSEVNVLNLGTLEDSSDTALLISPEVARKLGIDFSVQLSVKLSPRPDSFDEIASGQGVLSYGESVYAGEDEPYETSVVSPAVTDNSYEETYIPPSVEDNSYEEAYIPPSTEDNSHEEAYIPPSTRDNSYEETYIPPRIEPEADLSALDAVEKSYPVAENEVEEKTDTPSPVVEETVPVEEKPLIAKTEPAAVVKEVEESAIKEFSAPIRIEPVLEEISDEPLPALETDLQPVASNFADVPPVKNEPLTEKFSDSPISDAEPFDFSESVKTDVVKDEPVVSVVAQPEPDDDEYEYEEIVEEVEEVYVPEIEEVVETTSVFSLNPTDAVVPEYDPKYAHKSKENPKKKDPPKKIEVPKKEPKPAPKPVAKEPANKPAPKVIPPAPEKTDVVVKDKNLREGSYYVQIATVTTKEKGVKIVNKYSKYPVVLVPFDTKEGYKVMVGPLTGDEYGAVMEKFKSFGYRDSFVRKIK